MSPSPTVDITDGHLAASLFLSPLLCVATCPCVDMRAIRRCSSVQKLINKVTHLGQSDESSNDATTTARAASTSASVPRLSVNVNCFKMAEEEDFSSLPLTDRWVHKVGQLARPSSRLVDRRIMAANGLPSSRCRSGKFARQHTRRLQSYSRLRPTIAIPLFAHLSRTRAYGKGLSQIRMLPHNKMV